MLKLKKLQILGFKSFCDRTELKFPGEGIAAIVGPNGCGKSNISDAISWVLGEQSAKSLRGVRMEDVIFAGTRDRKPTGMAEVSLTLIDPGVAGGSGDSETEPQIEIHDGFPASATHGDDWDEAELRAVNAEMTEAAVMDAQPGQALEEAGQNAAASDSEPANTGEGNSTESKRDGVVLKIRRRKFDATPINAAETVITRRLFRSGDSEYLLNGKLCRLRDIQDLFMGTGLGPESYAIIEQGRIGQILSSKPYDRRAIIEEAAGITKYKSRKRLAEARLESAKLNLSRINDIFDEVARQMNSLKRQASKAERYSKLRDEMREKLRLVLASKFAQLSSEATALDVQLESVGERMRQRSEAVEQMQTQHADATQHGYAVENAANQNREQLSASVLEVERATTRQRTNEERCAELAARTAAADAELARGAERLQSLTGERESNRAVLDSAAADVAATQHEAQLRQEESARIAAAVIELELQQEALRSHVMDSISAANRVRNQITQGEEHMVSLDREAQRLHGEIALASADIEQMGGRRGQLGLEFESESHRVSALLVKISELRAQIEERRAAESQSKRHLDSMRAEFATALGKRGSLEALISEHGYSTESVKRLFQSGAFDGGRAPVGVLADFLEVDHQYESVIEDFLRDELNYIVVKSWEAADEGLRLLKHDVDGRATFLVHPSDSQAKFSFLVDENLRPSPPRDTVVPLTRCIQVLNGFGKSLEVIFPKLRSGYIAPDAGLARELALENPDAFYLAPTGETFHNVTVTGGKQRNEGPLSMKRELRDVLKLIGEMEQAMRAEQARVQTIEHELKEFTSLLTRLEDELRLAEKQAMTHGHALNQMESEISRTQQRLTSYLAELDRADAARSQSQETVATKHGELRAHEAQREALQLQIMTAQHEVAGLKIARDAAIKTSAEVSVRLASLEERRRSAASSLERIESLATEVADRVEELKTQIAGAVAEKEQREEENVAISERLIALSGERESLNLRAAELNAESEEIRARLVAMDHELKQARHDMDAARDLRGELAASAAKLQSDIAHMGETCLNELGITSDELRSDQTIAVVIDEALALEDAAHREMRARLESMGPVNMMALEEYTETAERHQFLETQCKDLQESIENTQNTIKEIDTVSREKFEEAFHKINENFQRTFHKLFGGGQGFMRLTDQENTAESGIDIVASPPGKKLQNVLLLSGGEKALTALALLVGIFQYQPSPFCILDEVDAPLDDSNIVRFAELIREMSAETQFILITHSKRTMATAPVMYGVTMQEPGVSKVISVTFGEERRQLATA